MSNWFKDEIRNSAIQIIEEVLKEEDLNLGNIISHTSNIESLAIHEVKLRVDETVKRRTGIEEGD